MTGSSGEIPDYARGYEGFGGRVGRTSSQSTPWWKPEPSAPAGAPNIVVVLIDARVAPPGADTHVPPADAQLHLRVTSTITDRHATME